MRIVLFSLFCLLGAQYAVAWEAGELSLPGPAGYCLEFDGNDSAKADPHPALDLAENNQFTLEAWVYRRPEGRYWQVALCKGSTNPYGLTVSEDEFLHFELHTTVDFKQLNTPTGSVPFDTWTHIAGTWDGQVMRAYVDGVEKASYSLGGIVLTNDEPFVVGAASEGGYEAWNGMIDEIRIWNVARTANEIRDSAAVLLRGDEPGLVAYWRFDEGSGQWAYDSGPKGIALRLGYSNDPDYRDPTWVASEAPLRCPEDGRIRFGHEVYPCSGSASVVLSDSGLLGAGTCEVLLSSTGGDYETGTLTSLAAIPCVFNGDFPLAAGAPVISDGTLQVAHGDIIAATYEGAQDGTGNPAIATATATVDCVPPIISNVATTGSEWFRPVVSFDTDEPTTALVRFGASCVELDRSSTDEQLSEFHAVHLTGIEPETHYFVAVDAYDLVGNLTTGDNNETCYSFTTKEFLVPPFFEGFESGTLEFPWEVTGTNTYRTRVVSEYDPHSGTYHMVMDSSQSGTYSRNEATLTMNLEGLEDVILSFWAKSMNDEAHGPPLVGFVDGADFDGVAISEDGVVWYEVQGLRMLYGAYAQYVIGLDTFIETYGLDYSKGFKIRFNQYDNDPVTTDGIAIDDIKITADPRDDLKVTPREGMFCWGLEGGPFRFWPWSYWLMNRGVGNVDWVVECSVDWLNVHPTAGTLLPGASTEVVVSVSEMAESLGWGLHTGALAFTNACSGISRLREVTLAVSAGGDQALFFDGGLFAESGGVVALDLRTSAGFTIEAAVQRRSAGEHRQVALGKGDPNSYSLAVTGDGRLEFMLRTTGGTKTVITPVDSVPLDTWVGITGSWDGSTLRAYVNGEQLASGDLSGTLEVAYGGLFLGSANRGVWNGWAGMIDEVRIWDVVRSATEVRETWNRFLTGDEEGLIAYWRMDEGFGQWAYDSSPSGMRLRLGMSEEPDERDPLWIQTIRAQIEPPIPRTMDDLVCTLEPKESELSYIDFSYQWFRNGEEITGPIESNGEIYFATGPVLSHYFTAKNDEFWCEIGLDGDYSVPPLRTPPVGVLNSLPTTPLLHIAPQEPSALDGLSTVVTGVSTDDDGDEIGYEIRWYKSRDQGESFEFLPTFSGPPPIGIWIPPGYLAEGEIWRVEVIPFETGDPDVEGEAGWDQVYVGVNSRPVVVVDRPGPGNEIAFPHAYVSWEAEDADGDAVTVDLYYDTDGIEGGATLIAEDLPEEGMISWVPPGLEGPFSGDLSGDGIVDAEDLFMLAMRWGEEVEGERYRIFARAWDAKGAIGEGFSPGEIIVPEGLPGVQAGLLGLIRQW